ncbi:MAG TPA: hypothetical protein VFS19_03540 [Planctomycetota bacterium]|nr:hypothetical protein [Planctomycetota bacterium]
MAWKDVEYEAAAVSGARIERFLTQVRSSHANGGAILASFAPKHPPDIHHADLQDIPFWERPFRIFLGSPSVRRQLPELHLEETDQLKLKLQFMRVFEMEGSLVHVLVEGGAYSPWPAMSLPQAREVSQGFVEELFGDRYSKVMTAQILGAWSPWFHDVAWDHTFLMDDEEMKRMWILCITDSD